MKSLREEIESAMRAALRRVLGPEADEVDPVVRPTQDPRFGDYQSNVALGLAKRLGRKPRELAQELVDALEPGGVFQPPELAGPGFINFRIRPGFLAEALGRIQADPRLGLPPVANPQKVVVDFSSPNLAKEMHVGHLRSTIIGDAIARLLEFQGHDVLRLNHVGDWGTQFGMLLQYVRATQPQVLDRPEAFRLDDLEAFYREAKQRFDADPAFADAARRAVVDLQRGDPGALRIWEVFCRESLRHAHEILERLDVEIEDRGESFYNPMLPEVVEDLRRQGLAVESQGAVCVFLEGFTNREGNPQPMIVQKGDGGYNYDTTDLAGIRHRVEQEGAQRIVYVTDIRQRQHFDMVFAAARAAGWAPEARVSLEHVGFGMVLGEDRRPFKTRTGDTVKLKELLREAEERALAVLEADPSRRAGWSAERKAEVAAVVGIGAVKYSDLSHNLASDYVFDWDTMLAMEGNTAPYMLYAYARIRSIGRRAGIDWDALPADTPLRVEHESEIGLARKLLEFGSVLGQVSAELKPHFLTDYLYELSRAFNTFYDRIHGVRVIDAETAELRASRLRLCDLTARTLRQGIHLLGIRVLEEM
jgi:arginyl-tRNA synthetase